MNDNKNALNNLRISFIAEEKKSMSVNPIMEAHVNMLQNLYRHGWCGYDVIPLFDLSSTHTFCHVDYGT